MDTAKLATDEEIRTAYRVLTAVRLEKTKGKLNALREELRTEVEGLTDPARRQELEERFARQERELTRQHGIDRDDLWLELTGMSETDDADPLHFGEQAEELQQESRLRADRIEEPRRRFMELAEILEGYREADEELEAQLEAVKSWRGKENLTREQVADRHLRAHNLLKLQEIELTAVESELDGRGFRWAD